MQALEFHDNSLQWESERQNRLHQSAVEQKKKQMWMESAQRDNPRIDTASAEMPIALDEWIDKVHRIPEIRSALIPLDDGADDEEWSKPFSLAKADMEPWLSFYKGYKQSRLFLENSSTRNTTGDEQIWPTPDYAVRAILELKQVITKLIAEPPVQINRQVEYFDLEGELKLNREPMRVKALLKSAASIHDAELRRAVEKGKEMGNLLHDALLGEGHGNLIKAWTKVFNRKPTIDELHLMLTTGRVKASPERRMQSPEARPKFIEPRSSEPSAPALPEKEGPEVVAPNAPVVRIEPTALAKMVADTEPDDEAPVTFETKDAGDNKRKILWYLIQAAVCCAALAAIAFTF